MSWESVFSFVNLWALAGWLLLAAAPRTALAQAAVMYVAVGLLCLIYTLMLGGLLGGILDGEGPSGGMDFTTLAGVMALFDSKGGATIGWTHYLAFDLFTGLWIARDADAKAVSRWLQLPFLALTFLVGPVGLLAWLIVREPRARAQARARAAQNG